MMNITIYRNAQQLGPYTDEQVGEMLKSGDLSPFDLARIPGMIEWKKLSAFFPRPQTGNPSHSPAAGGSGRALAWLLAGYIALASVPVALVALAAPDIPGISRSAASAKTEKIALNLVSVAAAARSVGYAGAWKSKQAAIRELTAGISVTAGGRKMEFRVEGVTPEELKTAAGFLELRGENLIFIPPSS